MVVKLLDQINIYVAAFFSSWALGWVGIDFVVFPHMGRTEELSREFLNVLTQCNRGKLDRAVLKSLRPLDVKVGYLFTMKRATVLTIIVIVSNLTVNALLII